MSEELSEVIQEEEGRDSSSRHTLALSLGLRPPSLAMGPWPASTTGDFYELNIHVEAIQLFMIHA